MNGKPWKTSEIRFLLSNRDILTAREIADKLKRTKSAVLKKTTKLRKEGFILPRSTVYEKPKSKIPSKSKFLIIIKNKSVSTIASELSVSESTVLRWMHFYEIKISGDLNRWTHEEDRYLTENFGLATLDEIGDALERSKAAVSRRASLLRKSGKNLPKKSLRPQKFKGKRPSKAELESLLENFSSYQISKKIGTSDSNVRYWIKSYELEIPEKKSKQAI